MMSKPPYETVICKIVMMVQTRPGAALMFLGELYWTDVCFAPKKSRKVIWATGPETMIGPFDRTVE